MLLLDRIEKGRRVQHKEVRRSLQGIHEESFNVESLSAIEKMTACYSTTDQEKGKAYESASVWVFPCLTTVPAPDPLFLYFTAEFTLAT
jgi:hypothetical protein